MKPVNMSSGLLLEKIIPNFRHPLWEAHFVPVYPLIRTFVERPGSTDLDREKWGQCRGPVPPGYRVLGPVSKLPKAFLELSHS